MKLNPTFSKTLALVAPVTILTVSNSFGASDYFLKIDGIKGESTVKGHEGTIQIESFSWGMSNSATVSGGGTGKVSVQDFHFTMKVDKASPKLMLACATGQRIETLQFAIAAPDQTGSGSGGPAYYVITLTNVLVSSYQSNGAATPAGAIPEPPTAAVSFNFQKIRWDYTAANGEVVTVDHTAALP